MLILEMIPAGSHYLLKSRFKKRIWW